MSVKSKTIAVAVAGLLAVAGGIYAYSADDQVSAPSDIKIAASGQVAAQPTTPATQDQTTAPSVKAGEVQAPAAAVAGAGTATQAQPTAPAPKKLTKQQLTPPAPTEAEKLQKAAEGESNF